MRVVSRLASCLLATACFAGSAYAETTTVDDCVRRALDHAPAIRIASSQTAGTRSAIAGARAAYLPSVSAHGEYGKAKGYDEAITNGGSTQAVVRVETKLLDGGVRGAELAAANARYGSSTAAERQQRADVAFAVRSAYYAALAASTEVDRSASAASALGEYAGMLERQAAASAATENDAIRAKLAVSAEETKRRQAESDLAVARGELASLIGEPLGAESLVEPVSATEDRNREVADDVDSTAAVAAARAAVDAAEQDARAIHAEAWGNLTLNADAGAIGIRPTDTFERDGGAQFLLGISIPLFDGGARASRESTALAEVAAARARLDEARRTVALTLERLRAEQARARAEIASSQASLPLAEKDFRLIQARQLGGGSARLLDVLDAHAQVTELRRSITRAVLAARQAAAERLQALGQVEP